MFKSFNFRRSSLKLTYLLMVPLIGLAVSVAWGLQALQEAQAGHFAALQTHSSVHAGIRAAQAAEAAFARLASADELKLQPPAGSEASGHLRELAAILAKLGLPASSVDEAARQHARLLAQSRSESKDDTGPAAASQPPVSPRSAEPYAALGETMKRTAAGLENFAQQELQRADSASDAHFNRLAARLAGVFVLASAIGLALRVMIRRNMQSSTRVGAEAAQRIAEGDLTVQIEVPTNGQSKATLAAMKKMIEDLRALVGGVAASARAVADASAQISQGNLDLSQRTEQQASTLEETAGSMEELSSTVAQTADNARQANQLAVGASEVARKGGQAVNQVVATMTGISESSRRIGDITGVIDGIAFQTNILALNAAVEAARAGEQGRGFAVVAAEVRSLAQRSAAAAKEIKGLIGDSMDKVEAGTRQVDAAGKTMEEIVASVKKVSDLIAEIAAATQEQSSGIGHVNTAVTQLEHVMQQNASLAEEATAATESLKGQADWLLQMVSRFNIGEQQDGFTAVQPATPRTPEPIQVRRGARPSPAYAALGAYAPKARDNRDWEEF